MAKQPLLKVLELYSGIGGMHYALRESGVDHEIVAAVDINTTANEIYKHNYSDTNLLTRSIESLSKSELDKLAPNTIMMSPPCQPYCRVGKQMDIEDPRTKSFIYLMDVIPKLATPVTYILVENVKGFDTSLSRDLLIKMLNDNGYDFQEFLLSPLQFGIPNSRLRYYLLAKKSPLKFNFDVEKAIRANIPDFANQYLVHIQKNYVNNEHELSVSKMSELANEETNHYEEYHKLCRPLSFYLEKENESTMEKYMIPDKFLKRFWVMDIVTGENQNSCCFTKRYGHHIEGAGSIIQMNLKPEKDLLAYKQQRVYNDEVENAVRERKLRFFSPREIANLLCFPPDFELPPSIGTIQGYRTLGNSLNVHVVSVLTKIMLYGD